jgi:hypothetical protein
LYPYFSKHEIQPCKICSKVPVLKWTIFFVIARLPSAKERSGIFVIKINNVQGCSGLVHDVLIYFDHSWLDCWKADYNLGSYVTVTLGRLWALYIKLWSSAIPFLKNCVDEIYFISRLCLEFFVENYRLKRCFLYWWAYVGEWNLFVEQISLALT